MQNITLALTIEDIAALVQQRTAKRYMNATEAAEYLNLNPQLFHKFVKEGDIRQVRPILKGETEDKHLNPKYDRHDLDRFYERFKTPEPVYIEDEFDLTKL